MKRTIWLISSLLLASGAIWAQTSTQITIGTNPSLPVGPRFVVDGTSFIGTQTFFWPVGSAHTVQFPFTLDSNGDALPYQSTDGDQYRFTFGGWTSDGTLQNPGGAAITLIADPSLTTLTGSVSYTVQVNLNFSSAVVPNGLCSTGAPSPQAGGEIEGIVYFDQTCYDNSDTLYVAPGVHSFTAYAYPGWALYGYIVNNYTYTAFSSFSITVPTQIIPLFSVAKRVDFLTSPLGRMVLVDGTPIQTPQPPDVSIDGVSCAPNDSHLPAAPANFTSLCLGQFDLLPGSQHQIGAPTPQQDSVGNTWIFNGFSDGLGQNSTYVPDSNTSQPDVITANFVLGVITTIASVPSGMKIMIDGGDYYTGYNFIWGQGTTHTLSAESPQTDAKGRVWTFVSWSDGGAQTHNVTTPAAYGYTVTATYTSLEQVTVNSSPAGLTFAIDGANCTTPCVINKAAGSTSQVTIPGSIPNGAGSRYDFSGWNDGSTATSRTVAFNQDTLNLTASYQTSYQLTEAVSPAKAGTFQISPVSNDGYYASGVQVSITAVAANGFKFVEWAGDLSGNSATGLLPMTSPHAVIADFIGVPYIPPAGIESVTGPTLDGSVAAGSLIAIYGQSLASAFQMGPSNPLGQAIGNTTVTVNSFILPLVFVSPTLIAAQVPWELQPGVYPLAVHNQGQPDVSATLTISRDSPGAFTQVNPQQLPLVLAVHQDGTLVTFDSPAIHGEQITIYGTGFGPYNPPGIDGFPAVSAGSDNLADSIMLLNDSGPLQPDWAGAAQGQVGVAVVKLTIGDDLPSSTNMNLTISVNGRRSIPVVLPLQ